MKVVLIQNVAGVGKEGQQLEVKPGYARNYLFRGNFALEATEENIALFEARKKQREKTSLREQEKATLIKKKIDSVSITIPVEVKNKETEEIFGSVTSSMICKALQEEGISVEENKIILASPIKKLGIFNVPVALHDSVQGEVKVWVVKK